MPTYEQNMASIVAKANAAAGITTAPTPVQSGGGGGGQIFQMADGKFLQDGKIIAPPKTGSYLTGTLGQASTVTLGAGGSYSSYNPNTGQNYQYDATPAQTAIQAQTAALKHIPKPEIADTLKIDDIAKGKAKLDVYLAENKAMAEVQASTGTQALKNPEIANVVDRNAVANPDYINALYQEAHERDATTEELRQFSGRTVKDAANLILGANKSPFFINKPLPGATDLPESNVEAAPEIANEDGTIDQLKLLDVLQESINEINDMMAREKEIAQNIGAGFETNIAELGQQLGTTTSLIQGEQVFQEQRYNIQRQLSNQRLQAFVDSKSNVIEAGNLQLKFMNYADNLRADQRTATGNIISTFLSNGVPVSPAMANQYAKLTGIDPEALQDGFAIAAKNYLAKQQAGSTNNRLDVLNKQSGTLATDLPQSTIDTLAGQFAIELYGGRPSNEEGQLARATFKALINENPYITEQELRIKMFEKATGYTIVENKDIGSFLLNKMMANVPIEKNLKQTYDLATIARALNEGNIDVAISNVENIVLNQRKEADKDNYMSEDATVFAVKKAEELKELVAELEESGINPIGTFSGTFESWIGRFQGTDAANVAGQAAALVAQMRNRLSGTAVTESEANFLAPIILSLFDSPENFDIKLDNFINRTIDQHNSNRIGGTLPETNADVLAGRVAKEALYMGARYYMPETLLNVSYGDLSSLYDDRPEYKAYGDAIHKENPSLTTKELFELLTDTGSPETSFNSVGGDTNIAIADLPRIDTFTEKPGMTRSDRNNNPGNIKISDFTKDFPGVRAIEQRPAEDGGNFIVFATPQDGLNAIGELLKRGRSYKGVSAEQAIKRYNGGGAYGASDVGLDPNRDFQSQIQNPVILQSVIKRIAKAEGYSFA